jgi:RNA polymerase sigma-70 factor (ECF subfamily)
VRLRFGQLKTLAARVVGVLPTEAAALGDLYDRFAEDIYRYLYCRTGSPTQAEELTLQVLLQARRELGRGRSRPLPAWLYALAESACTANDCDHLLASDGNLARPEVAAGLSPSLLARALARASPQQREVLLLKFVSGLGNEAIALSLGMGEPAVCDLQLRGLVGLRTVLDDIGEQSGSDVELQRPHAGVRVPESRPPFSRPESKPMRRRRWE